MSRDIADQAGTVVVEDLNTRAMTSKGGSHKRGLNREILSTGWAGLRQKLGYKAVRLIEVRAAYTSQRCHECGTSLLRIAAHRRRLSVSAVDTRATQTSTPR